MFTLFAAVLKVIKGFELCWSVANNRALLDCYVNNSLFHVLALAVCVLVCACVRVCVCACVPGIGRVSFLEAFSVFRFLAEQISSHPLRPSLCHTREKAKVIS